VTVVDAASTTTGVIMGIDSDGALLLDGGNGLNRILTGDVTLEGAYR
jgi:biotin-(acetyl-CoA carboxylase) ligase